MADNDSPQPAQPNVMSMLFGGRSSWIQSITSPLGFCVLALLIVETFLLGAGMAFGLDTKWKLAAIGVGVLLFLIVFEQVLWLIVHYPQNLTFTAQSHVQVTAMKIYGSDTRIINGSELVTLKPAPASLPAVEQPSERRQLGE
jgi:hypothetical protein